MKNRNPFLIYLAVWLIALLAFWVGLGQDAMGYSLLFFYGVFPVTIIVSSFMMARCGFKKILGFAIVCGVGFVFIEYLTFSLANMINNSFNPINLPQLDMLLSGIILSFVGAGMGAIFKRK